MLGTVEVVKRISKATGLPIQEATRLLGIILGTIITGVRDDGKVVLTGLCRFTLAKMPYTSDTGNPKLKHTGKAFKRRCNHIRCKFATAYYQYFKQLSRV